MPLIKKTTMHTLNNDLWCVCGLVRIKSDKEKTRIDFPLFHLHAQYIASKLLNSIFSLRQTCSASKTIYSEEVQHKHSSSYAGQFPQVPAVEFQAI